MVKFVNVRLVVALSVVVCASVFIGASGARDIDSYNNSPAEAPSLDSLPKQCSISGPCGVFVQNLILMKAMPSENDGVCCQELVQTTEYCWEKIMDLLEEQNTPAFANLHPWAENAWNKCVSLASSPSQAPKMVDNSPTQTPTLPEQCRITGPCGEFVADLIVSKALPSKKDAVCCQEIVQTTKYCWEKVTEILEDPNIPDFANLHPWAENTWNKCVSFIGSPLEAPTFMPEQCRISESSEETLTQLLETKTLPSQKDVTCCREVIQTGKDCWEKTIEILEDTNVPALALLHPWAENVWNKCLILNN